MYNLPINRAFLGGLWNTVYETNTTNCIININFKRVKINTVKLKLIFHTFTINVRNNGININFNRVKINTVTLNLILAVPKLMLIARPCKMLLNAHMWLVDSISPRKGIPLKVPHKGRYRSSILPGGTIF